MTPNEYCPMHEGNTQAIGKHTGQWKILLWILGIGIGTMSTIAGAAYYSQQEAIGAIAESVHSIDKTMTAYVASHTAESKDGFRRITNLEEHVKKLDTRVDALERN